MKNGKNILFHVPYVYLFRGGDPKVSLFFTTKSIFLLSVFASLSFSPKLGFGETDSVLLTFEHRSTKEGEVRIFEIKKEYAEKIARWKPFHKSLPITIRRAAKVADKKINEKNKSREAGFQIYRIQLQKNIVINKNGMEEAGGVWFYLVIFEKNIDKNGVKRGVVVLMDGNVLLGDVVEEGRLFKLISDKCSPQNDC